MRAPSLLPDRLHDVPLLSIRIKRVGPRSKPEVLHRYGVCTEPRTRHLPIIKLYHHHGLGIDSKLQYTTSSDPSILHLC